MKYKMLVLDLDDTLLTDDHRISEYNRMRLIEAQEAGVYVVLASGRPTPAMLRYAEELELARFNSYIISFNGAQIISMRDQAVLFDQSLTKEEIHDLHDFSLEHNVHIITYIDGQVVSETQSEYIDFETKLLSMPHNHVSCFKTAVTASSVKCLMLEEPSYLKQVEGRLKAAKPHLSVAISKPFFLEIMPTGIDKAASIKVLSERLGILQEEIIAVGNAGNDLSMVEYAGLGVWVDNVTSDIRDRADFIVASNNNNGVAEVVERFIFEHPKFIF